MYIAYELIPLKCSVTRTGFLPESLDVMTLFTSIIFSAKNSDRKAVSYRNTEDRRRVFRRKTSLRSVFDRMTFERQTRGQFVTPDEYRLSVGNVLRYSGSTYARLSQLPQPTELSGKLAATSLVALPRGPLRLPSASAGAAAAAAAAVLH